MSPEELDEARAKEAYELWCRDQPESDDDQVETAKIAARLAREGWTPPEPVTPDLIAVLEFLSKRHPESNYYYGETGKPDALTQTCLAAYKAGREQEQERAKGLVEFVGNRRLCGCQSQAKALLAKYWGDA